jgi:hypothetical protein
VAYFNIVFTRMEVFEVDSSRAADSHGGVPQERKQRVSIAGILELREVVQD